MQDFKRNLFAHGEKILNVTQMVLNNTSPWAKVRISLFLIMTFFLITIISASALSSNENAATQNKTPTLTDIPDRLESYGGTLIKTYKEDPKPFEKDIYVTPSKPIREPWKDIPASAINWGRGIFAGQGSGLPQSYIEGLKKKQKLVSGQEAKEIEEFKQRLLNLDLSTLKRLSESDRAWLYASSLKYNLTNAAAIFSSREALDNYIRSVSVQNKTANILLAKPEKSRGIINFFINRINIFKK